jgi:hypothetical protein
LKHAIVLAMAGASFANAARADAPAAVSDQPAPAERAPDVLEDTTRSWMILPSGHAAFGIGGGALDPNLRLSLDASLGVLFGPERDHTGAWTVAPSLVTGFGASPAYASLDFGRVIFAGTRDFGAFGGFIVTAGPAIRVEPTSGLGGELSARMYFFVLQFGIRAIAIATNGGDVQIQATLGLGLF